jgi:hypothetical protein
MKIYSDVYIFINTNKQLIKIEICIKSIFDYGYQIQCIEWLEIHNKIMVVIIIIVKFINVVLMTSFVRLNVIYFVYPNCMGI